MLLKKKEGSFNRGQSQEFCVMKHDEGEEDGRGREEAFGRADNGYNQSKEGKAQRPMQ